MDLRVGTLIAVVFLLKEKAKKEVVPQLSYSRILNNEKYCDVKFLFPEEPDAEPIWASKVFPYLIHQSKKPQALLAAVNPVFDVMFYGNIPSTSRDVEIKEADRGAFLLMLEFLYSGDIEVDGFDISQLMQVVWVAHRYDAQNLESYVTDKIIRKLTPGNACESLLLAKKVESSLLVEAILNFLKTLPANSRKSLPCASLKSEPKLLIELMKKLMV